MARDSLVSVKMGNKDLQASARGTCHVVNPHTDVWVT